MRLIALHIYKWQDRKSLSLSTQIDVSSFTYAKRETYKDLINFLSKEISGQTERSTSVTAPLDVVKDCYCYCLTSVDCISATAVVDKEYHSKYPEAAFVLLHKLMLDFREHFSHEPEAYEEVQCDTKLPFL